MEKELNVRIRNLCVDDAKPLFQLIEANRGYLAEWLPWAIKTLAEDQTTEFIRHANLLRAARRGLFCVILLEHSICGVVGYVLKNDNCHISYWVGEGYTGIGVATSALKIFLDCKLREIDPNKVIATISKSNIASLKVAKKCGFKLNKYSNNASNKLEFISNGFTSF